MEHLLSERGLTEEELLRLRDLVDERLQAEDEGVSGAGKDGEG
jgi:hypothetical protein